MLNPLALIAERWTPTQKTVRRATLSAVLMSIVIVVTGGAVRLTGSGLGCDTWPKCSDDSLLATSEMGMHGAIEFGNRLLTYVLCAAVGWAIIAARSTKPWRRELTRLGWLQFWVVMGNAVLGGAAVLTELNPYTVAAHFLLATGLITITYLTWHRAREGDGGPDMLVGAVVRRLTRALVAVSVLLLAAGTVVTGTGPHAGDSSDVPRMGWISWDHAAKVHSVTAWAVIALTVAIWVTLKLVDGPAGPLSRTRDLFLVLMSQAVIGYAQYLTDVPEVLVMIHLFGSTLVWIAVLRVVVSLRHRPHVEPAEVPPPAAPAEARPVGSPAP